MSTTNNNLLTEISALVIAALLIIAGVVLLYVGKIDYANSVFFFLSALGIFGFNSAWKAPSPTQQAQIAAIASQQSNTISQMVAQQAVTAPAAEPGNRFTTPVPQAGGTYVPPPAQFIQPLTSTVTTNTVPAYEPFSTYPSMPTIGLPQ
jgi:hypothetical protein